MEALEHSLRDLWARASTLDERLSGAFVPVPGDEAEAEIRFQAWLVLAAEGDPRRLARRFAFDRIDEATVRDLLGLVAPRVEVALPPELDLLREVFSPSPWELDPVMDEVLSSLPFGEIFEPFLRVAQHRLDERLDGELDTFGPTLRLGCARGLAARLCEHAEPTLALVLQTERAQAAAGCYRRVVAQATGENAVAFWQKYAALARGLAVAAEHWIDASAELLFRLQADAQALIQVFGPRAAGMPVELQTGLGDPHRGGRGVARLRFASGLAVFYKPRDLSLDRAFKNLLDHMRQDGVLDDLRVPAVLDRQGYGWVEGVDACDVTSADEIERYFERGGALLCLAHLLDITDCHSDNVVAVGEHPVLIDLETVCHQRAPDLDERYSDAERRARNMVAASVLGTGLLPNARLEGTLRVELGGLSPGAEAVNHTESARWVEMGTDSMHREPSMRTIGHGGHQLYLDGKAVSVRAHGEALERGFTRTARHVMARREAWCAPTGPLAAFASCEARFIFRGTLVYGSLLNRLSAADLAQEGVDRSLLLEVLTRPLLDADSAPVIWPVLAAERALMSRLDVPHFNTSVSAAVLQIDGIAPIEGYLQTTGLERLTRRIGGFCDADLARELGFLRASLARPMTDVVSNEPGELIDTVSTHDVAEPIDEQTLRDAAMSVAELLAATAIWGDDDSVTWIDGKLDALHDSLEWRSLPPGLGDGVAGVALLLAALEHVGAEPRVRRLRLAAQHHLALGLAQISTQPVGGLTGAPSVAYALAHIAALTGDRSALALAATIVDTIPQAAIDADLELDVANGVAGTLLCLVAVRNIAEVQDMPGLAEAASWRIRACAARLRAAQAETPDGLLRTIGGRVHTGLSHGQAGFALAIGRMRESDGAAELQSMARAALAFEREHRVEAQGNWLDLRTDAPTPCSCAWCHGAPGIGLVRAVLHAQDPTDEGLAEDIAMAAGTTSAEPDAWLDHLCCGSMGLAACTQAMGESLGEPKLLIEAQRRASRVAARAKARGGYSTLLGAPAGLHSLGMYTGMGGVGYAMLRLVEPRLPAVITLA